MKIPWILQVFFLQRHFRMDSPQIERAHRDGPKMADKPRHFLIKMLSYQDKRHVMSQQRNLLVVRVVMYFVGNFLEIC